MICVHGPDLATVVAGFVCILVIHVVRDTDFREYHRMITHVPKTFVSQELELVTQAVSNSRLSNFDSKGRAPVLATEDTYHVDIVEAIPVKVSNARCSHFGKPTNASSRE